MTEKIQEIANKTVDDLIAEMFEQGWVRKSDLHEYGRECLRAIVRDGCLRWGIHLLTLERGPEGSRG